MKERRNFMKLAAGAAVPVAAAVFSSVARGADGSVKEFVGAWTTVHSLPFPPGSFREFLTFGEGGTLQETNLFLYTNSNLDLSAFGLPNVINASDGMGNWDKTSRGEIQVVFRKLLFDGSRRNFGDLKVDGTLRIDQGKLHADWLIWVVDANDRIILPFGSATSEGTRIT